MSYDATQLGSNAIYRMRFTLQDNSNDPEVEFLLDAELQYLLDKYSGDEGAATLEAAKVMLAQFAQYVRQREGQVEVYGSEMFDNWKDALQDLEKELIASSKSAAIIVGGVVKSRVNAIKDDPESVGGGYEQGYLYNQITQTAGNRPIAARTSRTSTSSGTSFKL